MIPLISGILYRLGGSGKFTWLPSWFSQKVFRWGMGLPIALITHNAWYILTYLIATNVFVYGDNSRLSKLIGRKGSRIVHGLAFGLASLHNPLYSLWVAVVFYILFEMADHEVIDNKWSEFLRGLSGTLIFAFN